MEISLPLKKKSHKNNKTNNCKKCFWIDGTKIESQTNKKINNYIWFLKLEYLDWNHQMEYFGTIYVLCVQSFNNGNWKALEMAARDLATQ